MIGRVWYSNKEVLPYLVRIYVLCIAISQLLTPSFYPFWIFFWSCNLFGSIKCYRSDGVPPPSLGLKRFCMPLESLTITTRASLQDDKETQNQDEQPFWGHSGPARPQLTRQFSTDTVQPSLTQNNDQQDSELKRMLVFQTNFCDFLFTWQKLTDAEIIGSQNWGAAITKI